MKAFHIFNWISTISFCLGSSNTSIVHTLPRRCFLWTSSESSPRALHMCYTHKLLLLCTLPQWILFYFWIPNKADSQAHVMKTWAIAQLRHTILSIATDVTDMNFEYISLKFSFLPQFCSPGLDRKSWLYLKISIKLNLGITSQKF